MSLMTKLELDATRNLRELAVRRNVAYSVRECTDGQWRGVVYSTESHDGRWARATRATRMLAVESLTRILRNQWPMRRGPKARAA